MIIQENLKRPPAPFTNIPDFKMTLAGLGAEHLLSVCKALGSISAAKGWRRVGKKDTCPNI